MLDVIFTRTWWRYAAGDRQWFSIVYHWGNILEGCAWLIFAALVLQRFARHRRTYLELLYAAAFCTFAWSDFREAWAQSSWLIWLKLLNLIILFWLRHRILSRYYPQAKVY